MNETRAKIKTAWFWRKHADGPELLEAWDEFSVDENLQGFRDAVAVAYADVKSDDGGDGVRYIDIEIDYTAIERAFWPTQIEGEVEARRET